MINESTILKMEEEIVPLFPANTNYPFKSNKDRKSKKHFNTIKHTNNLTNSNTNGTLVKDVEKAELKFNGGVPTSLRCEDGVYRRLYQHASSNNSHETLTSGYITPSEDEDGEDWGSPARRSNRNRNSSCRWFLICIIVIFFLFLLYVPAYNNVSYRPGTVAGWSFNRSRNMRTYVLPDNVTVLNQPKYVCKSSHQRHSTPGPPHKEPDIFLLVIITSSLHHYNRRMAIRETWASGTRNDLLARRFRNLTEHFSNVNMTESLFIELGYLSNNVSLEDKRSRFRRDTGSGHAEEGGNSLQNNIAADEDGDDEEDVDMVPMLDEGNQTTNLANRNVGNNVASQQNNSSYEDEFRLINNNGANSFRTKNEALIDNRTEGNSKFNLDVAKHFIYDCYKKLGRFISNYYDRYYNFSQEESPQLVRSKRGVAATRTESEKTQPSEVGEKRAIYDEAEENMDVNALGNFEPSDDENDSVDELEEYDYQTEESNIMKIPRRGEEIPEDDTIKKALKDLKNTLDLSIKNDKLSLKYFPDKTVDGKSAKERSKKIDHKQSHEYTPKVQTKMDLDSKQKDSDYLKVKFLFLLGQSANENDTELQNKLDEEAATYGDIIQENFIDSYNNLTLKSVMLLKWVISNCGGNVHYVMKTDDDMFVNIPRLLTALKNKSDEYSAKSIAAGNRVDYLNEKLLMGDLICEARPISDMRSKWYSPTYMYSGKVYPKYLSGVGYVMSVGAAKDLYKAALDTPLFHLEDIFITGMCSHKAGITPIDHPGFSYSARKFTLCVYVYLITAHQVTPPQMRQMYDLLMSNNTHHLEACEARRLLNLSTKSSSSNKSPSLGKSFLGSPRNIITGLAGFGYADALKKKLKKANNGCS